MSVASGADAEGPGSRRLPVSLALCAFVGLLLVASVPSMCNDEGQWHYAAWLWLAHGKPLYTATLDNKPPAIYLLFALSQTVTGLGVLLPRALGCLSLAAAALMLYSMARRWSGRLAGIASMVTFAGAMGWKRLDGPFLAHTEIFQISLMIGAFWVALGASDAADRSRRWPRLLVAGVLAGAALSFKQVALLSIAALVGWVGLGLAAPGRGRLRVGDTLVLLGGVAVGALLFIVPVLAAGATWGQYVEGTWRILLDPGSRVEGGLRARWLGFASTFLDEEARLTLFYIGALVVWWARKEIRERVPLVGIGVWLAMDFIAAAGAGRYYGHQVRQVIPALALLFGVAVGHIAKRLDGQEPAPAGLGPIRSPARVIACLVVGFVPLSGVAFGAMNFRRAVVLRIPETVRDVELGRYVREHTHPTDTVLVHSWNASPILVFSEREAVSRHFTAAFIATPHGAAEIRRDTEARRPGAIITDDSLASPEWLTTMLAAGYREMVVSAPFRVYLRR